MSGQSSKDKLSTWTSNFRGIYLLGGLHGLTT